MRGEDVECEVINGGLLGEHQGINLPGIALSIPALTEKDRDDLEFGLKHGVDVVALSFVRSAADIHQVKQVIQACGSDVPVIAKLEKPQALEQLDPETRDSPRLRLAQAGDHRHPDARIHD